MNSLLYFKLIIFALISKSILYAADTEYRNEVLSDNPIVYYQFDESSGTAAVNSGSSGAANDGTIALGTVTVNQPSFAKGGKAYEFSGGIVEAAALPSSLTEWSMEAWINWDPSKSSAANVFGNDQGGWNNDVLFGIGAEQGASGVPAGNVGLIHQGAPNGPIRDFVKSPMSHSEWHHVVVTASTINTEMILYVDGVEVDRVDSINNGITMNGAGGIGNPFIAVGAAKNINIDISYRNFIGLIDEFAIYGTVLTAADVASHYAASGEQVEPPAVWNGSDFGLNVIEYAPGQNDPAIFKLVTHIAFGPGNKEIVSDYLNDRLMYRDGPSDPLLQSPIPIDGVHSILYNPVDNLYYANDTENNRLISFADLSSPVITAETSNISGVNLNRPHDIVIDPATGWIYALNPSSGHVFRFSAIGQNESVLSLGSSLGGYSRSLTFANGRLYAIGSAAGRIVEVVDWDTAQVNVYNSFGKIQSANNGTWSTTGLVLNDIEYFNGYWYASSMFSPTVGAGTDPNENKLIRFRTLADFVSGNWEDISSLMPDGLIPYYFTVKGDSIFLAIFDPVDIGTGNDVVLRFTPTKALFVSKMDYNAVTSKVSLEWDSSYGATYQILKSLDLDTWVEVGDPVSASTELSLTTSAIIEFLPSEDKTFYRIALITE